MGALTMASWSRFAHTRTRKLTSCCRCCSTVLHAEERKSDLEKVDPRYKRCLVVALWECSQRLKLLVVTATSDHHILLPLSFGGVRVVGVVVVLVGGTTSAAAASAMWPVVMLRRRAMIPSGGGGHRFLDAILLVLAIVTTAGGRRRSRRV